MSEGFHRYSSVSMASSPLDPFDDVLSWIDGLKSRGYTSDLLRQHHGFSGRREIQAAARAISTHTSAALGLIEQARSGPDSLSFLPLYYSILNLSKAYIWSARKGSLLSSNRQHGASYDPLQKSSRDIRTETLRLMPKGVLGVFYQTLTGESWYASRKQIALGKILPFVSGVSFEHRLAFGTWSSIARVSPETEKVGSADFRLKVSYFSPDGRRVPTLRTLRLFRGLKVDASDPTLLVSPRVQAASVEDARTELCDRHVRRFLFYDLLHTPAFGTVGVMTPVSSSHLFLPEEIPIWLAFFYLSSVVRYRPEFLAKLADSRTWPFLAAMRRHSLLRFLLLFWSHMNNSVFYLTR